MMLSLLSILAVTVVLIFCIGSIQTVHGFVGVSIQRWQLHRTLSSREIITTLIAHHQPQDNDDIPSSSNSNYLSLIEKSTKGHGIRDKGLPSTATTAITTRRENLSSILSATSLSSIIFATTTQLPQPAYAKCTDIESCREEGERKIEADLISNPIVKLSDGVRYRVLSSPPNKSTSKIVTDESNIDIAYSISTASGQYMYSKGFGYEKINFGDKKQLVPDKGLDSLNIILGKHNVPIGIERALIGMTRGEIRRIELPPNVVGFESSNWKPSPITRRGKTQIEQYKRKLVGFGSQPPFPAETVWDVEVLIVR
jgi:hypothetical protein